MKEENQESALGQFIGEQLRIAKLSITKMCKELHMGTATYEQLKKNENGSMKHYIRVFNYHNDNFSEEELLEKMTEWIKFYIRCRRKYG